jgi:hypothetical protein
MTRGHFFLLGGGGGGGGGAFGGTYPSVVRVRFGPGFDDSFGMADLIFSAMAAEVVALSVARIPLFEDSLTVPVELVA